MFNRQYSSCSTHSIVQQIVQFVFHTQYSSTDSLSISRKQILRVCFTPHIRSRSRSQNQHLLPAALVEYSLEQNIANGTKVSVLKSQLLQHQQGQTKSQVPPLHRKRVEYTSLSVQPDYPLERTLACGCGDVKIHDYLKLINQSHNYVSGIS